jgi:hypothetical protein
MALGSNGTLSRRRAQRSLEETIAQQRACAHPKPAVGRGGPQSLLFDYVCPDCRAVRRTYLWRRGVWELVRREEDA